MWQTFNNLQHGCYNTQQNQVWTAKKTTKLFKIETDSSRLITYIQRNLTSANFLKMNEMKITFI